MGKIVIDMVERGKQIDQLIFEINQLFDKYKISNFEAIWILETIKFQMMYGDLGNE